MSPVDILVGEKVGKSVSETILVGDSVGMFDGLRDAEGCELVVEDVGDVVVVSPDEGDAVVSAVDCDGLRVSSVVVSLGDSVLALVVGLAVSSVVPLGDNVVGAPESGLVVGEAVGLDVVAPSVCESVGAGVESGDVGCGVGDAVESISVEGAVEGAILGDVLVSTLEDEVGAALVVV